jgi:hypothetical protein
VELTGVVNIQQALIKGDELKDERGSTSGTIT